MQTFDGHNDVLLRLGERDFLDRSEAGHLNLLARLHRLERRSQGVIRVRRSAAAEACPAEGTLAVGDRVEDLADLSASSTSPCGRTSTAPPSRRRSAT